MKKRLSVLSNILLAAAIIAGIYVLIDTWLLTKDLPPGVCPIQNNRPVIFTAIGLTSVSFILSLIADRKKS